MEFRQLEAFTFVVELKSFSKAADYLFLSQSTVSSHIKNLEKELGKNLILRTTKTLRLTKDGEIFFSYAKRILETRNAALNSLKYNTDTLLHLGASTIPSAYLLPRLLAGFRKIHPKIRFHIFQGDSQDIQERVLDGTIDLGFVGKEGSSSQCVFLPFCHDELVLVTPATIPYKKLKRENPSISTLLQNPVILREEGSGTQASIDELLRFLNLSSSSLDIVAKTNDLESIKLMIVDGLGVSICSRFAIQDLEFQQKVISYLIPEDIKRNFCMTYLKTRNLHPILQELVRYTEEQFGFQ